MSTRKKIRITESQLKAFNRHIISENKMYNDFFSSEALTPEDSAKIIEVLTQFIGGELSNDPSFNLQGEHKLILPKRLITQELYDQLLQAIEALKSAGYEGYYDDDRQQLRIFKAGYFDRKKSIEGQPMEESSESTDAAIEVGQMIKKLNDISGTLGESDDPQGFNEAVQKLTAWFNNIFGQNVF